MTKQPKTALRNNLLSLVRRCPVELSNPKDCPLFGIRKLGPARRLRWFDDLTKDDLAYLNAYHCVCAQLKMESKKYAGRPETRISIFTD